MRVFRFTWENKAQSIIFADTEEEAIFLLDREGDPYSVDRTFEELDLSSFGSLSIQIPRPLDEDAEYDEDKPVEESNFFEIENTVKIVKEITMDEDGIRDVFKEIWSGGGASS